MNDLIICPSQTSPVFEQNTVCEKCTLTIENLLNIENMEARGCVLSGKTAVTVQKGRVIIGNVDGFTPPRFVREY